MAHDSLPVAIDEEPRGLPPAALGLRVELPRPLLATQVEPSFGYVHPAAGLRVIALGEAARLEGHDAAGAARLLGRLSRDQTLEWLDGAPGLPLPPGPWLAAIAFNPDAPPEPAWRGFAPARFILPAVLAWSEGGRHYAAAFAAGPRSRGSRELLRNRLDALRSLQPALDKADISITSSSTGAAASEALPAAPSAKARASWSALIAAALAEIRSGRLDKVVVARAQEVMAASPWEPGRLLEVLAARHPGCRAFLIRGDDGAHFVGATPELLCAIDGRDLRADAVAGSAPPAEAAALPGRAKDLREHRWVVEHLVRGLRPLTESLSLPPEPGVRVFPNVAHLVTPVAGRLRPGVDPGDVVAALHPTPAVCGEPPRAALDFLTRHEGLGRGLYAGLVGFVGPRGTELAVALRSVLLRGGTARVFAGAGIVEGSDAGAELIETELKAAAVLRALAACAPEAVAPVRTASAAGGPA